MKTTIRSLALLLSLAVFFSACSKNKDDVKGSFTYENKTYTTNYAANTTFGSSYSDFFIASGDYTTGSFSGKVNGVGITFDNLAVTAGTYTYKSDNDPDFDPKKNFFDAYAVIDVDFPDANSGTFVDDIASGTATVSVNGSNVTITYDLNFDNNKKVTGSYSGTFKQLSE